MKTNLILRIILALAVLLLIGGACYVAYYNVTNKPQAQNSQEQIKDSNLEIVEQFKIGIPYYDTMNPLLTNNREIINLDMLIFEPLVNVTEDYHTEKCLAKEINKQDDLTYEIKIDTSIRWQDGSSFISRDIQFTIETLKALQTSTYHGCVADIASATPADAETIIIKLTKPVNNFEYNLTFPILPYAYYLNEDFINTSKIPIGTGLYKIASIDGESVLLTRNDRYRFLKDYTPKTPAISIKKCASAGEVFNSFKLGGIDFFNTNKTDYGDYVGTMGYTKKTYTGREYDFVTFNCSDSILAETAVRQAIALGINRESVLSAACGNRKILTNGHLDYGSYLHTSENLMQYNQDQARRLLEEAGWTYSSGRWIKKVDGQNKRLIFNIMVNSDEKEAAANNIKAQLEEIGIIVNVNRNDAKFVENLYAGSYQIAIVGINDSINPDLTYFYGDGNIARYNNDSIKSKLSDLNMYQELQKEANTECVYIPLYRSYSTLVFNVNMGGEFTPNNYNIYYNFYKWYRQQ